MVADYRLMLGLAEWPTVLPERQAGTSVSLVRPSAATDSRASAATRPRSDVASHRSSTQRPSIRPSWLQRSSVLSPRRSLPHRLASAFHHLPPTSRRTQGSSGAAPHESISFNLQKGRSGPTRGH